MCLNILGNNFSTNTDHHVDPRVTYILLENFLELGVLVEAFSLEMKLLFSEVVSIGI